MDTTVSRENLSCFCQRRTGADPHTLCILRIRIRIGYVFCGSGSTYDMYFADPDAHAGPGSASTLLKAFKMM